ncbi:acyl-CoA dehydrogenase family protein [Fodinicurvata sp. EGI_FJ10296]|uniref:acyl-CoA dehydrogenase family protein n=1 Tax=Fodinicurvata sp. EGI_FJ10296 TaxID=3231908 RepID=UPI003453D9E7
MADTSYLHWPFFDDDHRRFAAGLDAWAADSVPAILAANLDHHDRDALDATCRSLVAALGRAGWLKACIPGSHGGLRDRLDVRSLCLARDILARHSGLADFALAMQGLGTGPISLAGTKAQQDRYLAPVAAGEKIAAFALSEQEAGSDVAALATTARRDGDGYVIDGSKTWISNGGIADHYVVFARTGEAPGAKGLSAFVVEAGNPGLSIAGRIDVIAPHPLATLQFDHCRVDGDALIGKPGDGFRIAMATLDVFRSTVGAAALGLARRALDETLSHTSARHLFGAPLADLQMTQARIADMATGVDAAALMVYRAAWAKDCHQDRVTREASMAKMMATETAQKVVDDAVQLHGGAGVTTGVKVEELYRDVRALRIYEGATEVQKLIIARQTLAEYAKQ